jgi:hypothetical protein
MRVMNPARNTSALEREKGMLALLLLGIIARMGDRFPVIR